MSPSPGPSTALCLAGLVAAASIFAYGFLLPGLASSGGPTNATTTRTGGGRDCFSPSLTLDPPTRAVLVVIDAWRAGFLTDGGSPMEFTRSSISSGSASLLLARVQTPTVTMPRIKAMTSGTVPSFASVLLNFHSSESSEDTWLHRLKETGKRLVFYGDDTWLRLFPALFEARSEGVTSFFVNDFTEVDNNVTRHLNGEMLRRRGQHPADLLILHYLGLDHIGHSLGGEAREIRPKLVEMDGILKETRRVLAATGESFLLVALGDHGMTRGGSHGGASPDETTVPVVVWRGRGPGASSSSSLIAPLSSPPWIEQMDVASMAAHLLGVPPPTASIGVSFRHLLGAANSSSEAASSIRALALDTERLRALTGEGDSEMADALAACSSRLARLLDAECVLRRESEWRSEAEECYGVARRAQSLIINRASSYDWRAMLTGTSLAAGIVVYLAVPHVRSLLQGSLGLSSAFSTVSLALHLVSFFASSLVEEEHELWYFFLATSLLLEAFDAARDALSRGGQKGFWSSRLCTTLSALVLHRIAMAFTMGKRRRWTMGEDRLPPPLIADAFDTSALVDLAPAIESLPAIPALVVSLVSLALFERRERRGSGSKTGRALLLLGLTAVAARCGGVVSDASCSIVVWLIVAVGVGARMLVGVPISALSLLVPLLALLVRRGYLPLLAVTDAIGEALARIGEGPAANKRDSVAGLVATAMTAAVFYQGFANSIPSIDIAVGYTGLSAYHEITVGVQIVLAAYAPVLCLARGYVGSLSPASTSSTAAASLAVHLVTRRAVSLLGCCLSLLAFSSHLFVWSVFAPRFLFELAHITVFALGYGISRICDGTTNCIF